MKKFKSHNRFIMKNFKILKNSRMIKIKVSLTKDLGFKKKKIECNF